MRRVWGFVVLVLVAAGLNGPRPAAPVPRVAPAGSPVPGQCYTVEPADAKQPFPWPGAGDCTTAHTVEVVYAGRVGAGLIRTVAEGTGENLKVAEALMQAEVRQACTARSREFLGGLWRGGRLELLAVWVKPARSGFYACALAETADAGAKRYVPRRAGLKDALAAGTRSPLAIGCVAGAGLAFVPCDEPHQSEFTGLFTVTPPNVPFSADGVGAVVEKGCANRAATYVGAARPDLTYGYVGPSNAASWLGSDQTYACYVSPVDGAVAAIRGTVRGIGTRPLSS